MDNTEFYFYCMKYFLIIVQPVAIIFLLLYLFEIVHDKYIPVVSFTILFFGLAMALWQRKKAPEKGSGHSVKNTQV